MVNIIEASSVESVWLRDLMQKACVYIALDRLVHEIVVENKSSSLGIRVKIL